MVECISERFPKARKKHRCDHCQSEILPGVVYSNCFMNFDGVYVFKSHLECRDLAHKIMSDNIYDYYEGIILHDQDVDILLDYADGFEVVLKRIFGVKEIYNG